MKPANINPTNDVVKAILPPQLIRPANNISPKIATIYIKISVTSPPI